MRDADQAFTWTEREQRAARTYPAREKRRRRRSWIWCRGPWSPTLYTRRLGNDGAKVERRREDRRRCRLHRIHLVAAAVSCQWRTSYRHLLPTRRTARLQVASSISSCVWFVFAFWLLIYSSASLCFLPVTCVDPSQSTTSLGYGYSCKTTRHDGLIYRCFRYISLDMCTFGRILLPAVFFFLASLKTILQLLFWEEV
jgi:hypothetical protein